MAEFIFNPDEVKNLCDVCNESCADYKVMDGKLHCIVCLNNELESSKSNYKKLENEFKEYVNRPAPTKDYISGGGWRG